MNNTGTMIRFEMRKILRRKITVLALAAVSLLMIAMNIGEYVAGTKIVNKEEQALVGRKIDDALLGEMRQAVEPKAATMDDGTQVIVGVGIKDAAYQPLMDYLTTIGGNMDKAYYMTETGLTTRFHGVIDEAMREQYLTDEEIEYWQTRRESSPMPLTYGEIQNGWGDSVGIIYVVALLDLIVIAATLSGMFSDERQLRTDALIFSSRNGKKRLVTAKLLAGAAVGLLETLVILAVCVITEFAISGFSGGEASVQFFVGPTAMDMPVRKAFLIFAGLMLIIGLLLSVFAMCLSQLTRSSTAVIAVMMGLWLVSMITLPYRMRFLSQVSSFLPVTFLGSWVFSDYRTVNLFGHLFTILQAAPVIYLLLTVLMCGAAEYSYGKYQVTK